MSARQDLEFEVQGLRGVGDDAVVLIGNQRQTGRHSGIVTEMPDYAMLYTLLGGVIVRWRTFPDHGSALRSVGLEA